MKKILTYFLFTLFLISKTQAQWSHCEGPYAGGSGAFLTSGTTIFATGNEGLFRSTDQGESWHLVTSGIKPDKISNFVTSGSNIYVLLDNKYVYVSEDNGVNWKEIYSAVSKTPANSMTVKDNTVFIGSTKGIYISNNNGIQWTYSAQNVVDTTVTALFTKGANLFAGTIKGTVYISTDNGNNWTIPYAGLLTTGIKQYLAVGDTLFAATMSGRMYLSKDNGKNWRSFVDLVLSFAAIGNTIFVGDYDGLYSSTDFGLHWTKIKSSITSAPGFFSLSSYGNTLYALGGGGPYNFVKTIDSGKTWSIAYYPGQRIFPVSFCLSGNNIFAGSTDGVYLSENDGTNWKTANTGLEKASVMAITLSGSNMFAGTVDNKGVFLSTNNGKSWKTVNKGLGNLNVYELITGGKNIIAGTEDGVYISSDNGSNWTPSFTTVNNTLGWVNSMVVMGTKIFAGTDLGSIYVLSEDETSWTKISKSLEGFGISGLVVRGTDLYAGTYRGVYYSTNNGTDWLPDTVGISGLKVFCVAVKGNTMFAGTDSGVFISKKAGTEWKPVDNTSKLNTIVTKLVLNNNTLLAGTQDVITTLQNEAGIWKYDISILDVEEKESETKTKDFAVFCYPNPATNTLTIDRTTLQFPENTPIHFTLSTLIGGKVMEFNNNEPKFTVQLNGLASGVYSLTAESGGNRAVVMVTVVE